MGLLLHRENGEIDEWVGFCFSFFGGSTCSRADVLGWFKTEKRASVVSGGRCLTVLPVYLFLLNRASNISISLHGWERYKKLYFLYILPRSYPTVLCISY